MSSHDWLEEGWDSLELFLMMVPISSQGHTRDHTYLSPPPALPSDKVESVSGIGTGSWILSMRWFYHVGLLNKSICGKQERAGPAGKSRVVPSLLGTWRLLGPCLFSHVSGGFEWTSEVAGRRWAAPHLGASRGRVWHGSCIGSSLSTCSTLSILSSFLCGSFGFIHLNSHPLRNLIIKATLNLSVPFTLYTEKGSAWVKESERSSDGMSG